jgi:phosphonate metabolism-associated iron-containing alcohol dehydrogenase
VNAPGRDSDTMSFRYHNPVAITAGLGSVNSLPSILNGRSVVLVTFPEARQLGLVDRLSSLVGASLQGVVDQIEPNPDVHSLRGMYEKFWREHAACDAIVAVGGGSAIDTAKALMVGTESKSFQELLDLLATGRAFTPHEVKPLIAVPTTAGTGSEVTPWATIWDRAANSKYSLHLPQTWPEAALIDPELMLTLPGPVTLQSGLDALSHALESIWNVNANPISDNHAVAAAREVLTSLPLLMKHPGDRTLRAKMALAALYAGLAFSNTKTALAHSISYEMTLRFGLPHGIACSFTLPLVLRRAIGIDAARDAVLRRVFDDLERSPEALSAFLHDLGVATDFSAYGIESVESDSMVGHALEGVRGRNFIGARSAAMAK